ncbi:hypothetical protein LLG10_08210 [bacterium]|nr:hypothetical protein [bacterium]
MRNRFIEILVVFLCLITISNCSNSSRNVSNQTNKTLIPDKLEDFYTDDPIQIEPHKIINNQKQQTVHFQYLLSNFTNTEVKISPREAFQVMTNKNVELPISLISISPREEENYQEFNDQAIELTANGAIYIRITIEKIDYNDFDSLKVSFKSPLSDESVHFSYVVK